MSKDNLEAKGILSGQPQFEQANYDLGVGEVVPGMTPEDVNDQQAYANRSFASRFLSENNPVGVRVTHNGEVDLLTERGGKLRIFSTSDGSLTPVEERGK
jgi:hypothetical protein